MGLHYVSELLLPRGLLFTSQVIGYMMMENYGGMISTGENT
jgi:hypothetical protein